MHRPLSSDEIERLRVLASYGVLDTGPEERFDRVTRLAARIFGAPIALISLLDDRRQWFKSHYGLDLSETPREAAFCAHAIQDEEEVFVVENALLDPRFADSPLVRGEPHVRFCAGAPLRTADGFFLGALEVLDTKPRTYSEREAEILRGLAAVVVEELERTKQAASAARDSEARFRALVEASALVVWTADETGAVLDQSADWQQFTGQTAGEARGRGWTAAVLPEDLARTAPGWQEAVRNRTRFECEYRVRRTDGVYRWFSVRAVPVFDGEGRFRGFVGTMGDVDDEKRAFERLREREEHLRMVVGNAPIIFFAFDRDGILTLSEGSGLALIGLKPSEAVGRSVFEMYADFPEVVRHLRRVLAGEAVSTLLNLEEITFDTRLAPLRDERGEVAGAIGVASDVTELMRLQEELRRAKRQAEEVARLKSALLANMSHEIRTPLTAILGFSTILADELPAEHRLFAQLIDRSGRRLLETLNSVLDLAQLESGRFHFEPTAVDLVERAREVAELFQPAAREKQLWLDVHAAQPEVVALCDPALVDRILNNLVGNAIKFTGSGGVSLEVGEEAGRAVLRVRDSGIGIGPEFIPHVFDEFRQESSGLARSFEGSGLGLTITRRLVELMNGAVEIDSEPGQGTVVTVRLPRSDHAPVTPAPPGLDAPGPACAPGRVLVVEDSTETQRLLLEMLGPPLRVDVAATVGEALALVARERYESILLDINLGEERTGRDVLEAIRTDGPNRDTPVVALTAYALPGDRERFLAAGFDAYLGKPFTRARLFETLEAVR